MSNTDPMPARNEPAQPPMVLAMIVCDEIFRDHATGKATILGTFGSIGGTGFPLRHPRLSVFVALTDGREKFRLKVRVTDVDEEQEIFSAEQDLESPNPLAVLECGFAIEGLMFPEKGEYRIQLFSDNGFLIERRLLVHDMQDLQ